MKKTLVIGLGKSGKAVINYLQKRGVPLIGVDKNPGSFNEVAIPTVLETELYGFSEIDRAIISPGVPLTHPLVQQLHFHGIEVIAEAELAMRELSNPVVAITGTNGKTTVTMLVEHVMKSAGKRARALGNVGEPLINFQPDETIVLELSSYQLELLTTKKLLAAVILNITPDHLDRYPSMEAYAEAKYKIGALLKEGAPLFVQSRALEEFGHLHCGGKIEELKENIDLFSRLDYKRYSGHDRENIQAAFELCRIAGITQEEFIEGCRTFKKPSHRIEFVQAVDGIKFYDDSKGTNLDATIRAVESMEGNVVLIAGGVDKGASYSAWITPFNGKVKEIVLMGEAAEKIEREIAQTIRTHRVKTLEEAVLLAHQLARVDENVLLSPGCASFDMFRDYADRGTQFQQLVRDLGARV